MTAATRPSISVVIPTHNEEKYIEACLKALKSQSVSPDEIIVVDNNSSDGTIGVVKQFKSARLLKEQRQGQLFALERGFDTAKGTVLAAIDADTVVPRDWVERLGEIFADSEIAAVSGPVHFYDMKAAAVYNQLHLLLFFKLTALLSQHHPIFGSNMAFRAEYWDAIKGQLEGAHELHNDMVMANRINSMGGIIKFDPGLKVGASGRRIRQPKSLIKYPLMWFKSLR